MVPVVPVVPVVSAIWWMARLFGVSREFWCVVFTAVHSSSFLTTDLDNLPAMMIAPVPTLE